MIEDRQLVAGFKTGALLHKIDGADENVCWINLSL